MNDKTDKDNLYRPEQKLDDELQRELDEALGGMSLADIIEAEEPAAKHEGGGVRTGTVVSIQGDDIFVSLGGRSEGVLSAEQFKEEPLPKVGDSVKVTIEGYDAGEGLLVLSREGAVLAAAWETLEEGQVVEARVTGHNKGGLELSLGGILAFMPVSQIELFRVEDLAPYVNQRLKCQVIEVDRAERNVIVSRRAVLELETQQLREKAWAEIEEGQVRDGVVRNVKPYGAFVDIGFIDGLLHVKDMAWSRVEDPASVVKNGQKIKVKVLKVDRELRKVSLGLKQVMPDPWTDAAVKWPADSIATGRVTRLADFGAFVELTPGVEGLVHISELSDARVRAVNEAAKEGQLVQVKVLGVDEDARRMSLSIKQLATSPEYTGPAAPQSPAAAEHPTGEDRPKKRRKPLKGGLD